MSVVISEDVLSAARMSEGELLQEIAVLLYAKEKLTLGQASKLAGKGQLEFRHLLASRQIPAHYDVPEFEKDLQTLRETPRS